MSLTTKDVIFALLKNQNPPLTFTELCNKAGLEYNALYKRVRNNTLNKLSLKQMNYLCVALNVAPEDFTKLIEQAMAGEFPDDYPKENITLPKVDLSHLEDRVVPALLTLKEAEIINAFRAESQERIDKMMEALEKKSEK